MLSIRRLRALRRRLRDDTSGVAFTEFALALPLLLILGLGGLETAHYALATQQLSQIAMTAADNASRVRQYIDESDVNDVLTGAKFVGRYIDFANRGRIILSDLEQSTTDTSKQWIRWQRCAGAKNVASSYGVPNTMNTSTMTAMGPPGNQVQSAANTGVMFVEVVYDYQPLVAGYFVGGSRTLRTRSAFNVRQRTDQAMHNDGNLTTAQTSDCTIFSA